MQDLALSIQEWVFGKYTVQVGSGKEPLSILVDASIGLEIGIRDKRWRKYLNKPMAEELLSTSGWRELLADFATGPQARLIAIKVMRVPGNPLIKVTFWLDDVKLTLAPTPAAGDRHRLTLPVPVNVSQTTAESM